MTRTRNWLGTILLLLMIIHLATGCQASDNANGIQPSEPEQSTNAPGGDHHGTEPSSAGDEQNEAGDISANATGTDEGDAGEPAVEPDVDLSDVTAVRLINHKSGWIGGEGWIAYSDNGGTEWEIQAQPKGTVRQIFALNGKEAWTVMENNDLYRTTNGGETWTRIGRTPNAGFLHFISPETGFSGHAITEDGGKTWNEIGIPDTTSGEVYFRDSLMGWAVHNDSWRTPVEEGRRLSA